MKRLIDDGAAAPWDRPDADGLVGPPSREADDADGEWDDEEWEDASFVRQFRLGSVPDTPAGRHWRTEGRAATLSRTSSPCSHNFPD